MLRHDKLAVDLLCRTAELAGCEKERALVQATLQEPAIERLVRRLVSLEDKPRLRALIDAGMDPKLHGAGSCIERPGLSVGRKTLDQPPKIY